ncbi:MAG: hypothetical protein J5684_05185 [Eubacterium sp.]|nr:hypothetical protein [Eubacterium sp.]
MEKNGVSKAKKAVNLARKNAKKAKKLEKKALKKQEKRERKDIKSAYMKALKKQSSDKMLTAIALLLAILPVAAQYIVDARDKKK